jgi:hypothetical protein
VEAVFLGQFLLQEGVITQDQLDQALKHQRRANRRLGELAVERGLIEILDAERVYEEQSYRDLPFGELAVEMGLMTRRDLDDLLFVQTVHSARLGEALLELGIIDKARHATLLERFFQARQGHTVDLAYFTDGSVAGALMSCLTGAVQRACRRFAGMASAVVEVGVSLDMAEYQTAYRYPVCVPREQDHFVAVLVGGEGPQPEPEVFAVVGRYLFYGLAERGVAVDCCALAPEPLAPGDLPRPAAAVRLVEPGRGLNLAVACGVEKGR